MPHLEDIRDITAYWDDSRVWHDAGLEVRTLADIFAEILEPNRRWPVLNTEPRTPISSQKRAIIHERDGKCCRMCGRSDALLTVDHIIPRSAFPPDQMTAADRSDNLISACWDCNARKSNFEHYQLKKLGIVVRCWYCCHPEYDREHYWEAYNPDLPELPILVFCGQCGISNVPQVAGWVL